LSGGGDAADSSADGSAGSPAEKEQGNEAHVGFSKE
jgi:hypothetical protein